MPRRVFSAEFRAEAVRLVREAKRPAAAVARELGINEQTIGHWLKEADADANTDAAGALTTSEREQLLRLRRENKRLQEERDIPGKAAAFFAKDTR